MCCDVLGESCHTLCLKSKGSCSDPRYRSGCTEDPGRSRSQELQDCLSLNSSPRFPSLFLRLMGEEGVPEIPRPCHEGSEEQAGCHHDCFRLTRQELPEETESCNNPCSVSILNVASPLLSFLLFCYNLGIFDVTMDSIALQGIKADDFTPLHSELCERRVIKCNHWRDVFSSTISLRCVRRVQRVLAVFRWIAFAVKNIMWTWFLFPHH